MIDCYEMIAAKDEANRANTAKTDFLLRMSHDIRTPINGIMGLLDIADMGKLESGEIMLEWKRDRQSV